MTGNPSELVVALFAHQHVFMRLQGPSGMVTRWEHAPCLPSLFKKHAGSAQKEAVRSGILVTGMPANTAATVHSQPIPGFDQGKAVDTPLLRFGNVAKEYATHGGRVRALNGLTRDVPAGSFLALVGRSGCGKSTLLNMAGAMDFPSAGDVLLDGVATAGLNDVELTRLRREKVGFIFQSFQLMETLSVVENVELPLLLAGGSQPRPRALERLEAVGLGEFAGRMPHQLSGGQMQRVAIARALVAGPRLVLADEPTGNLDTTTGNSILQLLQSICREHRTTILMATHSAEAAAFADSIVHLRDGQIEKIARN